ncbi:hypothetical protein LTR97_003668 [Elasticomyces elasticus]|uniref:F-box domain-containing protein n=1 Tax=Elasticomyces elasticus TaxID=574655 RepID=A0AAN7ZPB1_9PEZI|nr:hypothetical protein LTR97_003668 [Elasticomyces elasticus]
MKGCRKRPARYDMNVLGEGFDQFSLAEAAPPTLSSPAIAPRPSTTHSPRSAQPPKRTRFLDLPAEMRNAIYAELYKITVSPAQEVNIRTIKKLAPPPALTMTCRQIREETLEYMREAHKIFWNSRIFFFTMKYLEYTDTTYLTSTEEWCKTLELGPIRHFQLRLLSPTRHMTLTFEHLVNDSGEVAENDWLKWNRPNPDPIDHYLFRQDATMRHLYKNWQRIQEALPIANHSGDRLRVRNCIQLYLRCLGVDRVRDRFKSAFW